MVSNYQAQIMANESEKELEILEHINLQAESVHQRDLAKIVGSLSV
jgi:hypothetical protein